MNLPLYNLTYAQILIDDWIDSLRAELLKHGGAKLADLCPELIPLLSESYQSERGASMAEISVAEARLGMRLPSDYLSFVQLAQELPARGLAATNPGNRFLPVADIDFYKKLYKENFEIWTTEVDGYSNENEQIGVYGPDQRSESFCRAHLASCIAITTHESSSAYVLNPTVANSASWEAWILDFHLPGALRFPSFFALLEYEIPRSVAELRSLLYD